MKIAYIDCFAGIAGDMLLGAFIDAGARPEELVEALKCLIPGSWKFDFRKVKRGAISATKVDISREETHTEHTFDQIRRMIETSGLEDPVKTDSIRVFCELAAAESRIHGVPLEKVHFHEVGALDSIADIVGTVMAYHQLGIETLCCAPLPIGRGFVETRHGLMPLPAPATLELLKGIPTVPVDSDLEMVTPTGAAFVRSMASGFGAFPRMMIRQVGYGAGTHQTKIPNVLRLVIGETYTGPSGPKGSGMSAQPDDTDNVDDTVSVIEANIDDMSPELCDHVTERLLNSGANDVYYTPVLMKKNRPAFMITVIAPVQLEGLISDVLLAETTTLGVRIARTPRRKLERNSIQVQTPYGPVDVKVGRMGSRILNIAPEYESCRRIAIQSSVPLKWVFNAAEAEAVRVLGPQLGPSDTNASGQPANAHHPDSGDM